MMLFFYYLVYDVYLFDDINVIDIGDVFVILYNIYRSYELMEEVVGIFMDRGIVLIGIGGDYLIILVSFCVVVKRYGLVVMIYFDFYIDIWDMYYDEKYWYGFFFICVYEEGLVDLKKVF